MLEGSWYTVHDEFSGYFSGSFTGYQRVRLRIQYARWHIRARLGLNVLGKTKEGGGKEVLFS